MRQVTVTCDGCKKSRIHFDYAKFKNFKKSYLLDGWTINKEGDFCAPWCYANFKADKEFTEKRKALTKNKKWGMIV